MTFSSLDKSRSQLRSISQVTSTGGAEGQGITADGLTGLLWSPTVAATLSEYMERMDGSVLDNVHGHPQFVQMAFEHGQFSKADAIPRS